MLALETFSAATFSQSISPYEYMVECGFGSSDPRFPVAEMVILNEMMPRLPDGHKAFAFAIGETFCPQLFVNEAISQLRSSELSVRLGAYNCLVKLTHDEIDPMLLKQIQGAIATCPEREYMSPFGVVKASESE